MPYSDFVVLRNNRKQSPAGSPLLRAGSPGDSRPGRVLGALADRRLSRNLRPGFFCDPFNSPQEAGDIGVMQHVADV